MPTDTRPVRHSPQTLAALAWEMLTSQKCMHANADYDPTNCRECFIRIVRAAVEADRRATPAAGA